MQVRSKYLLVEVLEAEEEKTTDSGIIITPQVKDHFIKLKVLAVGSAIDDIKQGDIVFGERMVEPLKTSNNKIGLIKDDFVYIIGDINE
jgi:co-chaperonin GroES (HSP10)